MVRSQVYSMHKQHQIMDCQQTGHRNEECLQENAYPVGSQYRSHIQVYQILEFIETLFFRVTHINPHKDPKGVDNYS